MIEIAGVGKSFGATRALDDCTLTIEDRAFCVLIGSSGCGKSTLLRTINGLMTPDRGVIRVRGRDIAGEDPERLRQGIGYVIQSVGLFPHWTIADNIKAVPRLLKWDKRRVTARLEAIVALLRIDPALLPRYPHELSGGQRQRIGVARALASEPDLMLMDEPFSALDPVSRAELQAEMRRIHAESRTTIVMVTHDVGEALGLATSLAIMRAGRIVQSGPPASLIETPADDFVARFLGGPARTLHLLDLLRVEAAMGPPADGFEPNVDAGASLREALAVMMAEATSHLRVTRDGAVVGTLSLDALVRSARHD